MRDRLHQCFKQVILAQLGLLVLMVIIAAAYLSIMHVFSVAFGAALALLNTALSKRSIHRASELAYRQPSHGMLPIYSGIMQRFAVFLSGFFIGVVWWSLLPLPLLAGFLIAQFGYFACRTK